MDDDKTEPFGFPAVGRKKVAAAFDGGRLTSDGGVLLLAAAERQLGICDRLAALIADRRDPSRVVHPVADILRARPGDRLRLRGCRRPRPPTPGPRLQARLWAPARDGP